MTLFGSSYHEEHRAERQQHAQDAAEASTLRMENEALREAVRARDDTLAMVVGLPGFQRRHPQFAEGIRRLLSDAHPRKEQTDEGR